MSHAVTKPTDIEIPATSLWAKLPLIGGVLAVVGLGATLAMNGGEHPGRAMFSYLWAFEFVLSIALGGMGVVLIDHLTRAGWSVVVRRVGETAMATLPLFVLLAVPLFTIGMHQLYPWSHETDAILEKKRWFLTEPFFFGRAALYLVVWVVLSQVLYRASVRRDATADGSPEQKSLTHRMWTVSAGGMALYAMTLSFAAIDWVMSLQPHWYSTIWGVYFFAGSILAFYAFSILVNLGLQKAGLVKTAVTTEHFHDLGKYMFGFNVFWAYIAFSQFILIWYANIPEETIFYMERLEGGWEIISYALPVLHFFLPFGLLMSRHVKRNRKALGYLAVWILVVHALDLFWLILPNFGAHGEGHHTPHFAFTATDGLALVGMLGAFLAAYGFLLRRAKVIAVGDPRLFESLAHENY